MHYALAATKGLLVDMRLTRFIATHLARRTSGGRIVQEIEGLRFIAIAMVVLFHLAGYVQSRTPVPFDAPHTSDWLFLLVHNGDRGVPFFFMISGFVLALPFAMYHRRGAPPVAMRPYFLRRLTRLEPPYVAALLLFFWLLVLVKHEDAGALVPHLVASVAYVHNLVYAHATPIDSVAWSLEIEVQFYALAPLLTSVFAVRDTRARRATIVAGIAASLAVRALVGTPLAARYALSILGYLQYFLAGFLLCDIFLTEWQATAPSTSAWWDLVALVALPAMLWDGEWGARLFLPFAFLMFIAAFRGAITRRVLTSPGVVLIGGMCYSIYLLHYPIVSLAGRYSVQLIRGGTFAPNFVAQAVLVAPVVLLISGGFYALIERPCMDRHWPRRLASWLRGDPLPPAATPARPEPVP